MGGSAVYDDWEIAPFSNGVEKTLVLVGRTGNGKSGTANSIIGSKWFESKTSSSGVTTTCKLKRTCLKDGQLLNVIDTPGLFDVSIPPDFIAKEIAKCVQLAKHGIHAVLVVLSVRTRFSEEERDALQALQTMFGTQIVNYMIVVFTGGDEFDDDNTFEDYLGPECPPPLKDILLLCENRFVLFDNKTKDETVKAKQVEDLFSLVNTVIEHNGGKPYSDELFVELKREETNRDKEDTSEQMEQEEQLKRITETVELKMKEATLRLEQQLTEALAAQRKAEEEARLANKISKEEIDKLKEISELKAQVERSHEEQLRKITEMVESNLKKETARMEMQLRKAQAAQKKAEEEAKLAKKKSNDEMHNLRDNLDRMQSEAHDLRRQIDNKCAIM